MSASKTTPALSEQAKALKERLARDKEAAEALSKAMEGSMDQLDEVMKKAVAQDIDEELQFREAVQGSKGTGLQKSHRLVTLRQLRKQRDVSLRDVTHDLGIPFPHVSEIERGMRIMNPHERELYERWAGGRIHYRMVPYVELGDDD